LQYLQRLLSTSTKLSRSRNSSSHHIRPAATYIKRNIMGLRTCCRACKIQPAHRALVEQVATVGDGLHEVPVGSLRCQHIQDGCGSQCVVGAHVHAQLAAGAVLGGHL
jgi:hypothetical protein